MIALYSVVLAVGVLLLIAWIFFRAYSQNTARSTIDPETRLGVGGRRVVAGLVGFGMAGMSAEFSPKDLAWPVALVLAVAGAAAAVWYAGWMKGDAPGGDG